MFTVRKATDNDSVGIAAVDALIRQRLYSGVIPNEALVSRMMEIPNSARKICDGEYGNFYAAISDNGAVIGYTNYGRAKINRYENCGELYNICTLDNYRGQGVGTALLKNAIKMLNLDGYETVIVRCFCDSKSGGFFSHIGGILDSRVQTVIDDVELEYEIYRFGKAV